MTWTPEHTVAEGDILVIYVLYNAQPEGLPGALTFSG